MIEQLTILAPGLLGSSVAMAAREKNLAKRIVIWSRRVETRLQLEHQPWCDAVADTPVAAAQHASLVVLAAPVERIIELAKEIGPSLTPGTLVTDVGSVKGHLTRLCHAAVSPQAHFVGAHPMAGSAKTGWENGSASLFEKRVCFVTPLADTPPTAVETVARFWAGTGSEVQTVSPDVHDEIVANISHLPQAVATSLCTLLGQRTLGWRNFAGGGLRDTTRIAASDANMWAEIFQQNREEVLRALAAMEDELHGFRSALANQDWTEIRARLERGKAYRDAFRP